MAYKGLDQVDFGHIAAEQEENKLVEYFIETPEYDSVVNDSQKILVTGRKGSGKSAIYVALKENLKKQDKNIEIEALSLENYPWELHKNVLDSGVPKELTYVNSWKFVIWVLLAIKILQFNQPAKYKLFDAQIWKKWFDANRRWLTRFLTDTYGNTSPNFFEILADRARNLRQISSKWLGFTSENSERKKTLSGSINIINRDLESRIIEVLPKNQKFYLLFDQLDLGWDDTDKTKSLLIGLILAARDIVRSTNNEQKKVRIIIFLRSDIYEKLKFEDKNKLSQDIVILNWNEDRLKELIEKRIIVSAEGNWENVFTCTSMRSRQSQLSYLVKRTMLRPRDMIQFCSFALDKAQNTELEKIDNNCIYQGERPYSDYMRSEIQDESNALKYSIDVLFEIIKELKYESFKKDDFIRICEKRGLEDAEEAIQILIDLSVLGIHRKGGLGGGSKFLFRYAADHWNKLEPTSTLYVHPSLKYILNLTRTKS